MKIIQRNSNLELLRIISMMLVMLIHYLPLREATDIVMITYRPLKAFMNLELNSISFICVNCFILISGYFGIKWRLKSFTGLLFQILFWGILGYVLVKYWIDPYFNIINNDGISTFAKKMLHWYQGRWFISAYITLYVISPALNSLMDNLSSKKLLDYIIVFYIFSTVYGYFLGSREFNVGLSALSLFGLYLIGGWLRRSDLSAVRWNKYYDLLGFVICTLIMTFGSWMLIRLGVRHSIYGYLNPVVILESVFFFQFFRKLDIGKISVINYLAVGAFSAFLLHCHPYLGERVGDLWRWINSEYDENILFALLSIVLIYVCAILVDKIRLYVWNGIMWINDRLLALYPPRTPVKRKDLT